MFLYNKIVLFLLFSLCCISLYSQDYDKSKFKKVDHSQESWYQEILKAVPDYNYVKESYSTYFDQHPFERSLQKSQVRRWLMISEVVVDGDGLVRAYVPTNDDRAKLQAAKVKAKSLEKKSINQVLKNVSTPPNQTWNDSVGTWRMIGPYHNRTHNMFGGFNDRVFLNRFNTDNMIAGQSYGGLWTTQDAGATWTLTDAEFPNGKNTYANRDMYYGDIEVHPQDPDRIVVGSEAGVLISDNAGNSWSLVNTLNYIDMPTERSYFIAQKNNDTDVILASYGKKIYRTTDGGDSWVVVFDNSSVSSVRSTYQHNTIGVYHRWYNFTGLEFDYNDPNVVYLGALNSSNETILLKSVDAGLTFSQIANTNSTKWLKMIHSPSDPDHIYFATLFGSLQSPTSDEGIFKYDQNGNLISFKAYPANSDARSIDDVMLSQSDPNFWAVSGYSSTNVFVSTDGGDSFGLAGTGSDATVHADVRSFAIFGDTILVGTDGGLHISTDASVSYKEGSQWISAIDLWGFSSAFKGELVASGDDHGPSEFRIVDQDRAWHRVGGADSEHIQINKCDQNFAYGRDVYSPFRGEKVNDSTFVRRSNAIPDGNFKYLAQDPDECYKFYPFAGNVLKVSQDNMTNQTTLKTFSNSLTKVEVVLKNNNILYALENRSILHKSIDGGVSWQVITPPSSVTQGRTQITDIETDEDGSTIWLSYGQNQIDCKVVQSTDSGSSWTNVSGSNLPSFAVAHITYQRGTNGMVYIGLQPGSVWYKDNSASDWTLLGSELPMIGYITSMYTVPDMGKLRMGSSRGAWEHALPVESEVVAHFSSSARNVTACYLDSVQFFDYSSYHGTGTSFQWTFEGGTPSSSTDMNPKVTYESPGIFDVSLQVTDDNGQVSNYTRTDFIVATNPESCGIGTKPSYNYTNFSQWNYMQTPSMDLLNTQNYTMMAWIKGEGTQQDYAGILSHQLSNGSIHLNTRSANQDSTELGYHHPNGQWWWSSGHYLVPDQWTHVALVVEPTGISIYKNGVGSKHVRTVDPADLTVKFLIGAMISREGDRCFKGNIDEVAFYSKSLTKEEIRTMMHVTKNNPEYPAQHDPTLVSYYQFNDQNLARILDVTGSGKNGTVTSAVSLIPSDGPYGGGQAELLEINSAGIADFASPGVKIDFQSTHPDGQVVVSHIDNIPSLAPSGQLHEEAYYIIRNFGANTTFDPLTTIEFTKTGTISNEIASAGGGFTIWKRSSNADSELFSNVISNNISASAGNIGSILVNDASAITSFSQFAITRNPYPKSQPSIVIEDIPSSSSLINGGESISLLMRSDHQGFQLPRLNDADIALLGQPSDGDLIFSTTLQTVIIYSDNQWNKLTTVPILDIVNGDVLGDKTIFIGDDSSPEPSAIVAVKDPAFIRFASLTNMELVDIKYPIVGMLIFNVDEKVLQLFNGTVWQNLEMEASSLSVSSGIVADRKGVVLGGSHVVDNVVFQDKSSDKTIMVPNLKAEDIMNPAQGLMIYDTDRNLMLVFDGTFWNSIGSY